MVALMLTLRVSLTAGVSGAKTGEDGTMSRPSRLSMMPKALRMFLNPIR